ncbi:MAG: SRPBCC family protein [Actinobacteria bacterium]|nr:SRPBCC family protein [Actinomycetota bacterium]
MAATTTIAAGPAAVFAVLADPGSHAAIDGTGWVRGARSGGPITHVGQVFRMAMYHRGHPDGDYRIANLVEVYDPPRAIAWKPGTEEPGSDELSFGGWTWRYDLTADGSGLTVVTLTYDWSAVPDHIRSYLTFPPFAPGHLDRSLDHLAALVTGG